MSIKINEQRARRLRQVLASDSVDQQADSWLDELKQVDPEVETSRMRLLRLGRQLNRMLTTIAGRHGMTLGDWETLSVLRRSGRPYALSPTALARALEVTSGTVSVRIDRLQKGGLIKESKGGTDGRSRPVALTPAGHRRWREATADRLALESRLLSRALNRHEITELNGLLRRVMLSFEAEFGPPPRSSGTE